MPNGAESQEVLKAVASVACGPQWLQALAQYGLSTVGCRNTLARSTEPSAAKGKKGRLPIRTEALSG